MLSNPTYRFICPAHLAAQFKSEWSFNPDMKMKLHHHEKHRRH